MDLLNTLFTYDDQFRPLADDSVSLLPAILMQELNLGGDVMSDFELRKHMYDCRGALDDAGEGQVDNSSNCIVDSETAEKCRSIQRATDEGRHLIQENLQRYMASYAKVNDITSSREQLDRQFNSVKLAINDFLKTCLKHDHAATVVDAFKLAVDHLTSVRDGIVQRIEVALPVAQEECNRAGRVLQLLAPTYRSLRTNSCMFNCPICLDRQVDKFLMPCGHTFCSVCLQSVNGQCPMCRLSVRCSANLYYT